MTPDLSHDMAAALARIAELERRVAVQTALVFALGDKLLTVAVHLARLAERKGKRQTNTSGAEVLLTNRKAVV